MTRGSRPEAARLEEIVAGFKDRRVAVLADLVCDEFVHGDIARVSREAPVLILDHTHTEMVAGGGANAIANLRALGAAPMPVGVVGGDDAGSRLKALFRDMGVPVAGILTLGGYGTPTKSRVLAGGIHTRRQQIVRLDRGARHGELPRAARARLTAQLRRALGRAEGLLVADYGYGAAVPSTIDAVRSAWRGKIATVDSRQRIAAFRGMTACTPNQEELERALELPGLPTTASLSAAGKTLLERTGDASVLVTRGAKGMVLFREGAASLTIPAFGSGEVADVTGAGDTVVAAYTLALLAGGAPDEAAALANIAAGLVVMKYGTATVSPEELVTAIRSLGPA